MDYVFALKAYKLFNEMRTEMEREIKHFTDADLDKSYSLLKAVESCAKYVCDYIGTRTEHDTREDRAARIVRRNQVKTACRLVGVSYNEMSYHGR